MLARDLLIASNSGTENRLIVAMVILLFMLAIGKVGINAATVIKVITSGRSVIARYSMLVKLSILATLFWYSLALLIFSSKSLSLFCGFLAVY